MIGGLELLGLVLSPLAVVGMMCGRLLLGEGTDFAGSILAIGISLLAEGEVDCTELEAAGTRSLVSGEVGSC